MNKNTRKKSAYRTKKTDKKAKKAFLHRNEIIGIALAAIGILILLGIYVPGAIGPFGAFIKSFFTGLLAVTAYLIAPLTIILSLILIFKSYQRKLVSFLYAFILIVLMAAMIHTGYYDPEKFVNMSFSNTISKFFNDGKQMSGGGVLGGIVSMPFLLLFKTTGTLVILTALSIIDIILLTNVSIAQMIKKLFGSIIKGFKKLSAARQKKQIAREEEAPGYSPRGRIRIDLENADETEKRPEAALYDEPRKNIIEPFKKDFTGIKTGGDRAAETREMPKKISPVSEAASPKAHEMFYRYPQYDLLIGAERNQSDSKISRSEVIAEARKLEETLDSFGVSARVVNITRGPTVTRYELQLSPGVKVSRIVSLADDISLNLASSEVRIEAPIPGKAAIGIEVPNKEMRPVRLREVLESKEFKKINTKLAFGLGVDISGTPVVADITKMPHLLIAGATGTGKSVCLNNLIMSILYKSSPDEVKLLLIDPKLVELKAYNGIPHMLVPVVTNPKKAAGALNWAVQEMVNRYKLFADKETKDLAGYNESIAGEEGKSALPQIVIVIDELSDLMMIAPNEVEDAICRLAQMARAAGIYLAIATQRPSVDVITGVIKANIPSRISFAVSSQVDSRTILDAAGAEKLLGRGDMLYYPSGAPKPVRLQGALVTDKEIENVVSFIKSHAASDYNEDIVEELDGAEGGKDEARTGVDELLPQAIDVVVGIGHASVSLIQRKFRVGYSRAARIIDQMEERGLVSGYDGSKPRQVLVSRDEWLEMKDSPGNEG
ncbi:MAG: DNA translocase FtsK 4TM domain-containing protein [Eubacteriales bacterium]|nr:DNA translocase FtsK 4TM domain-containing protein [Eubacteriales bacterium]